MEESTKQLIQRGSCVCACGCGGGARGGEVVPRGGTEELVVADALLARDEEMGTTADKAIKCILRVSIFMYSCICVGFICLLAGSDISIVLKS